MTTDIAVLWEVQPVGPALWGGPAANGQRGDRNTIARPRGTLPPPERDCERTEGAPTSHQAAHQLRTALTAEPLVIKKDRWKEKKYFNINKYISLAKVLFPWETLSSHKRIAFPKKFCIVSQNICILSQKVLCFLLRSLTKVLAFPRENLFTHKIQFNSSFFV